MADPITLAGLAATALTAGVTWAVPKIADTIYNWFSGKGKGTRHQQMQEGGTTQRGGVKTTMLPGGDAIHQIEKHKPGFTKALIENREAVMKMLMSKPEKYPGGPEFLKQAQEIFGGQQQEIPEFDFGSTRDEAMQRFHGEIIPGLAERFTAITGGGQRSGAFARQTTRAGERLTKGLAGLEGRLGHEDAFRRAELGMTQRQQRLREAGYLSDIYGKQRSQQESWKDRMQKILYGEMPSTRDTFMQPAPEQAMTGTQRAMGPIAEAGTKYMTTHKDEIGEFLKQMFTPDLNTGVAT